MQLYNPKSHTSNDQDWVTPPDLIEKIEKTFNIKFDLDVCAYSHTVKALNFLLKKMTH